MWFFKARKKFGLMLLGAWLVLTGLAGLGLIPVDLILFHKILAGLAIAAGILIVLDR